MQLVDRPKGEGKFDLLKVAQTSFPYQPVFDNHSFEDLKLIAK